MIFLVSSITFAYTSYPSNEAAVNITEKSSAFSLTFVLPLIIKVVLIAANPIAIIKIAITIALLLFIHTHTFLTLVHTIFDTLFYFSNIVYIIIYYEFNKKNT